MKRIEPFNFWPSYASAIPGFGGDNIGPDPFYCFHTLYNEFVPGHVDFHLRMVKARASRGELVLRVHAFPADQSADAMMVSGSRLRLDELDGSDVNLSVRFLSLPGVSYALFGRYSEASDLLVEAIEVSAEELGDLPAEAVGSLQTSEFADGSFASSNKLCSSRPPSLTFPVSQPCTRGQLESDAFTELWPLISDIRRDPVMRWSMLVPLQMLNNAGLMRTGVRGLLLDASEAALSEALHAEGCLTESSNLTMPPAEALYDFVIAYGGVDDLQGGDAGALPERLISHVFPGGLVVTLLPFEGPVLPVRNRLQQIALNLIGKGHEMAQICFPNGAEVALSGDGNRGLLAILAKR